MHNNWEISRYNLRIGISLRYHFHPKLPICFDKSMKRNTFFQLLVVFWEVFMYFCPKLQTINLICLLRSYRNEQL